MRVAQLLKLIAIELALAGAGTSQASPILSLPAVSTGVDLPNQTLTLLIALLINSGLAIAWIASRYFSVKRHRDAITAANERLQDTVGILNTEIERRKEIAEQLRSAKDAAEQANHSKTQFLANMSHELRTPLNAVIGFADIISSEMLGDVGVPAYKEYAADILTSSKHLLGILSDILDMARIDAGKTKLSETEFEIGATIQEVVRMFAEKIRHLEKSLMFDANQPGFVVCADERVLRQILINLISNAIKYTRDRGRIDIRVEQGADLRLNLIVADNGIGIPREKLALILEPFAQVEDAFARSKGGI